MTYELAKQLKEAGFPHPEEHKDGNYDIWTLRDTFGKAYFKSLTGEIYNIFLSPGICYYREYVYIPTLSELIEACGYDFHILEKEPNTPNYWRCLTIIDSKEIRTKGETPEEAVAKLWLQIHAV